MTRNLKKYAKDYKSLPYEHIQEKIRKEILIKEINNLITKNTSILEIGSGRDSILNYACTKGERVVVEPIKSLLNVAINKNKNITKINDIFENVVKFFLNRFDLVVLSSLLHEIENPKSFLRIVQKVMKKNGKLIIITNNANSIHRILGVNNGLLLSLNSKTPTELKMQQLHGAFFKKDLDNLLKELKFKILKSVTIIPKILDHANLQKAIDKKIIDIKFIQQLNKLDELLKNNGSELLVIVQKK